jgi:hypothetical protein
MADERDPKISQRYRELGAEEPPRHVDQAILAASRRAVEARPAPLVVPTGRRRWYFPVAAAAVIVLAVSVAVHVERDQPDPEVAVLMKRQAEEAPVRKETEMRAPAAPAQVPAPAPAPAREQAPEKAFAYAPDPPRAASAEAKQEQQAQDRVVAQAQRADEAARDRRASSSAARPALEPGAVSGRKLADQPPEKWLETIAELRKNGQHGEADKLLEEFRKRFPDYKVPESALKK